MFTENSSCLPCVGRLDGLHKKLEGQGLKDVVYMVVNHHEAQAQRLHPLLEERLSQNIALYKQYEHQPDVWRTLNGEKDDFFIYDRFVISFSTELAEIVLHLTHKCCFSLSSDVADSLTTFHFHTTSLDTAMLSKQSRKPTAIVCVESAPLRYTPHFLSCVS